MKLHQIRIEFNPEHDRLLMSVSTRDNQELQFWLTRRCVKLLWPALVKLAAANPRVAAATGDDARAAVLVFEHERALSATDFSTPYEKNADRERPLGPQPVLVARFQTRVIATGGHMVSIAPLNGQGIDLSLDEKLLHSLMRLIQQAVERADWDLRMELPYAPEALASDTRVLN